MEDDISFSHTLDRMKESFLWAAAQGGNAQDCDALIEYGADPNWSGPGGDTSLIVACRRGHIEVVNILLSHGANINAISNSDGMGPIHICSSRGDLDMLNLILEANANVSLRTRNGLTAVDIAKEYGQDAIYGRLMQPRRNLAPSTTLTMATERETMTRELSSPAAAAAADSATQIAPLAGSISSNRAIRGQTTSTTSQDNNTSGNQSTTKYQILGPEALQEQEALSGGLRKLYEKEQKERKAAELKNDALMMTNEQLRKELSKLTKFTQSLEEESLRKERELELLRGDKDALLTLNFDECIKLEKRIKASLESIEERKERIIKYEMKAGDQGGERLCVICQEHEKSVVLLPCRHMCLCDKCASMEAVTSCPLCRRNIDHKINVFA